VPENAWDGVVFQRHQPENPVRRLQLALDGKRLSDSLFFSGNAAVVIHKKLSGDSLSFEIEPDGIDYKYQFKGVIQTNNITGVWESSAGESGQWYAWQAIDFSAARLQPEADGLTHFFHWECRALDGVDAVVIQNDHATIDHLENRPPEFIDFEFLEEFPQTGDYHVLLRPLYGRGEFELSQQPNSQNGFVTKITLQDHFGGADAYGFDLYYIKKELAPQYSKLFNTELYLEDLKTTGIPFSEMDVHLVGNAHIDLSWLWDRGETIHEICPSTFRNALDLMEANPQFCYSQSSAQIYAWVEKYYPEIFSEITQRIQEGRWEIIGGAWSEHNANIPSGESLVRQYLLGKRYFMNKFGVDVKVGWLPDVFGFNWNLPQIYKKSGIDYFMTHKLKWQEERNQPTVRFPHNYFWWKAPDGSQVLAHHTVGGYGEQVFAKKIATQLKTVIDKHQIPVLLVPYGHGDHGGGPNEAMVGRGKILASRTDFPRVKFSTSLDFFNAVAHKESTPKLPVVADELYVKTHRGTLTTDGQVKRDNRKSEVLLTNCEKLATITRRLGRAYPTEKLNEAWQLLLFGQVHDNLDGSSIQAVYDQAALDYQKIIQQSQQCEQQALATLARQINTFGFKGKPIVVFNSLTWERTDVAEIQIPRASQHLVVLDAAGNPVPWQWVRESGKVKLIFLAENVPSMGYRVFDLVVDSLAAPPETGLFIENNQLENNLLNVEIDSSTGCVSRIFDKQNQVEVLAPAAQGNLLKVYEDRPPDAPGGEPAWNIHLGAATDLLDADSIKILEPGPVRVTLRIYKNYQKSFFIQDVSLYFGKNYLETRLAADWHEQYKFLKVAFSLNFSNVFATFEIPFGAIERYDYKLTQAPNQQTQLPPRRWEPADQAKFEVAALHWADLSQPDEKYGASLLNDSKYAYSFSGNTLELSLLRGPRRGYPSTPESWSDQSENPIVGVHPIRYALLPHAKSWKAAGVVRAGQEFNTPLLVTTTTRHPGEMPVSYSFFKLAPVNLIGTALKKAEDSDAVVVRIVETTGVATEAIIEFDQPLKRATRTDLVEWGKFVAPLPLTISGNQLRFKIEKHAVETILVEF
jgi:alpha-mannosidase